MNLFLKSVSNVAPNHTQMTQLQSRVKNMNQIENIQAYFIQKEFFCFYGISEERHM